MEAAHAEAVRVETARVNALQLRRSSAAIIATIERLIRESPSGTATLSVLGTHLHQQSQWPPIDGYGGSSLSAFVHNEQGRFVLYNGQVSLVQQQQQQQQGYGKRRRGGNNNNNNNNNNNYYNGSGSGGYGGSGYDYTGYSPSYDDRSF